MRRFDLAISNEVVIFSVGSVPGTICTPHQIPCDSVQRRLLSIKMAVFMDRVCKIQLLSTKRAVFMDKMWEWRNFGLKDSITWCKGGAKSKRKIANPWKLKICDLTGTRSRVWNVKSLIFDNLVYKWFCGWYAIVMQWITICDIISDIFPILHFLSNRLPKVSKIGNRLLSL